MVYEFDCLTGPPAPKRQFRGYQPGALIDAGRRKLNMLRQPGENMLAPKRELDLKEISRKPDAPANSPKVKFMVFGEEMLEKEVKPSGNTGRVYLPPDWVGKHVKIIRMD